MNAQKKDALSELNDIFPALSQYKAEHSEINLQKLCVEIAEFCQAVYKSTQNARESEIYLKMIRKLAK